MLSPQTLNGHGQPTGLSAAPVGMVSASPIAMMFLESSPLPDPDKEQTQATTEKRVFQDSISKSKNAKTRLSQNITTATSRKSESMRRGRHALLK